MDGLHENGEEALPLEDTRMSFDFESVPSESEEDSDNAMVTTPPPPAEDADAPAPNSPEVLAEDVPDILEEHKDAVADTDVTDAVEAGELATSPSPSQGTPPADKSLPTGNITNLFEIAIRNLPRDVVREYLRLPPSDYVLKVLERIDSLPGEEWYRVEFDDGQEDDMAYDDVVNRPNGRYSLKAFERAVPFMNKYGNLSKKRKMNADSDYDTDNYSDKSDGDDDRGVAEVVDDEDNDVVASTRPRRQHHLSAVDSIRRSSRQASSRQTSHGGSSNEDNENAPGRRQLPSRTAKTLASRDGRLIGTHAPQDNDLDELAGDDDDDDDIFVVKSDLQPVKPSRRRKKLNRGRPPRHATRDDDSIEFETRRSSRANKNTKSMADAVNVDEDIYYEVEERTPAAPKVISMKEIFPLVGADFKDVHANYCDTCGMAPHVTGKGPFVPCQGCSVAHHKSCLGYRNAREHLVTKVGPEHFVSQCRYCIGMYKKKDDTSPSHDMCQTCHQKGASCAPFSTKKTKKQEEQLRQENEGVDPITPVSPDLVNKAHNVLFRCRKCRRGYHFEHLPSPNDGDDNNGMSEADLRTERLEEYAIDWKCKDCLDQTEKVAALMAWRPVDRKAYKAGQTFLDFDEDSKEYLIKWEGKSHAHCVWMPGAWVWGITAGRMRVAFAKRNNGKDLLPQCDESDAIPEEYLLTDVVLALKYKKTVRANTKEAEMLHIDNIAEAKIKFQGLAYDEAVWDEPPSRESPRLWKAFEEAYHEYLSGKYFEGEPAHKIKDRIRRHLECDDEYVMLKEQPAGLREGRKLMDYQMEGMNWLLYNFYKGTSVVLADEMGLGKTVQVVALITSLVQDSPRCWPFLIVVPNSTCPNWRREIKTWAPGLRVVTYHGGKAAQSLAFDNELFPNNSKDMKAHVVIMSYDSAQDDETRRLFKSIQWAGLIVDEGQRLKNDANLLYGALRAMRIDFRLLMTGTPLQNNKRELFNLIQFIDPTKNAAALDAKYEELTAENLAEVHQLIRPYILRRTKAEVLSKILPPMAQIIVPVSMTSLQEKLCKSIMSKNPDLIRSIFAKGKMKSTERGSLNNILMQLRKCLCHPFVYSEAIEERVADQETLHRNLIEASSKLVLLNLLLPKLKERGHRVLLFSQFLNQLDIMEDFLSGIGLQYQRLDGSMSSLEKQKRIDAFNAPDSELFAFLLSTRAGGVGINLATADTVIVLDPDFNPHQDIQAFSRAHRIGQQKKVLCFQFMTKGSVEEKIMQIGRNKMALDHALIESMDVDDDAGNDLESILKHGAEALFDDEKKDIITYDSASVDKLLDRSQIEETKMNTEKSAESQFSFARVWTNDRGELADDLEVQEAPAENADTSVWDKIIQEREEEARRIAEREKVVLGRGSRRRQAVRYSAPRNNYYGLEDAHQDGGDGDEESDQDADFVNNGAESPEEEESDEDRMQGIEQQQPQQQPAKKPQGTTPRKTKVSSKTPLPKRAKTTPKKPQASSPDAAGADKAQASARKKKPRQQADTTKSQKRPLAPSTSQGKSPDRRPETTKPSPQTEPEVVVIDP